MTDLERFKILDTPKPPSRVEIEIALRSLKYFEDYFSDDNFSNLSICFHNVQSFLKRYISKNLDI